MNERGIHNFSVYTANHRPDTLPAWEPDTMAENFTAQKPIDERQDESSYLLLDQGRAMFHNSLVMKFRGSFF